jgi:hypothetical protein
MYPISPQFDPAQHGCLIDLQKEHPYPFVYAEATPTSGGPTVKRWLIQVFKLNKQHRMDAATQTLKAISFCPFCGFLLAIEKAEDLLPKEQPEEQVSDQQIEQNALEQADRDLALEDGEDPL